MSKRTTTLAVLVTLMGSSQVAVLGSPESMASRQSDRWIGVSYASHAIALGAEQDGPIVEVAVRDGDSVKSGQVLFKLASKEQEIRAERLALLADNDVLVRRAQAEFAFAASEHARLIELTTKSVTSGTELAKRELELSIAKIRVEEARLEQRARVLEAADAKLRLEQRTVRSPIDGIVSRTLHARGQTIEKLDPVVELIDLDPLWIEFDCPLKDDASFVPGARVRVRRASKPEDARDAVVVHASRQADPSSGTFRVRLAMDNPDSTWRAGLKMWIELATSGKSEASPPK